MATPSEQKTFFSTSQCYFLLKEHITFLEIKKVDRRFFFKIDLKQFFKFDILFQIMFQKIGVVREHLLFFKKNGDIFEYIVF